MTNALLALAAPFVVVAAFLATWLALAAALLASLGAVELALRAASSARAAIASAGRASRDGARRLEAEVGGAAAVPPVDPETA